MVFNLQRLSTFSSLLVVTNYEARGTSAEVRELFVKQNNFFIAIY